jgi:Spy/CpxP family protein refolding chaperone
MQNDQPGVPIRIATATEESQTMKIMHIASNSMRSTTLALCALAIGTTPMWSQAPQDAPPPPPQQQGEWHHPGPEKMQERQLVHMQRQLNLTADQTSQIKSIFADTDAQMRALHEDTSVAPEARHEKMKSIHEASTAKIRAVLTDAQKPKFDAMLERRQERMEHHGGRDGGPGEPMNPPPPPPPAS